MGSTAASSTSKCVELCAPFRHCLEPTRCNPWVMAACPVCPGLCLVRCVCVCVCVRVCCRAGAISQIVRAQAQPVRSNADQSLRTHSAPALGVDGSSVAPSVTPPAVPPTTPPAATIHPSPGARTLLSAAGSRAQDANPFAHEARLSSKDWDIVGELEHVLKHGRCKRHDAWSLPRVSDGSGSALKEEGDMPERVTPKTLLKSMNDDTEAQQQAALLVREVMPSRTTATAAQVEKLRRAGAADQELSEAAADALPLHSSDVDQLLSSEGFNLQVRACAVSSTTWCAWRGGGVWCGNDTAPVC